MIRRWHTAMFDQEQKERKEKNSISYTMWTVAMVAMTRSYFVELYMTPMLL